MPLSEKLLELSQINSEITKLMPTIHHYFDLQSRRLVLEHQCQGSHKPDSTLPYAPKSNVGRKPQKPLKLINPQLAKFLTLTPAQQQAALDELAKMEVGK